MRVTQLISNRYELKETVGTGGMSSVYRAFDTLLERHVALKILHAHYGGDEEYVERFRREARAVAQLSHPNIVTVIDRGEEDGKQFIVFELIEGDDLKQLVERGGPLPVRRVLELGLEVGRALAFAHSQGLVHRDVKPQNVLLNGEGLAKVTDFGIVRSLDAVGHTETGTVLGTSHYIAPEQARGEQVDAQTDVYSFGVVLYELLAGEVPYSGDSFLAVAMKHVNDPVPDVSAARPDTPLRLASLVGRCLAKLPADRPASMDEVCGELQACLADLEAKDGGEATMIVKPQAAPQPARARQAPRARRRIPVVPLLFALLVLAAVVVGIVLAKNAGDDGNAGAAGGNGVQLAGVAAYDPDGGDGEHDDEAGLATDGDPSTFWRTSSYRSQLSSFKSGVGVVLDAGTASQLDQIAITTDTPGFTAEIQAGDSPEGPFRAVSESKLVQASTTWDVREAERPLLRRLDHGARRRRPRERGRGLLVLQGRAALVPLEREADQPVEQLRVRDPARLEQARVDARRREAGDRVQLVHDGLPVRRDEEVDAGHALALGCDEGVDREGLHALGDVVRDPGRDDDVRAVGVVLRGVVVPLGVRDDLADDGGERRRVDVAEHAALDFGALQQLLDEHLLVVAPRERDRGLELRLVVRLRDPDRDCRAAPA